jgi:TolB protein
MKLAIKIVLAGVFLGALSLNAVADDVIQITRATTHLIPITITGFTGEVESVLKFDLSVLGMEITDAGDYTVSGKNDGRVEGSLTQAGMTRPIFARAYAGGSTRSQAHALANDVVKELRQTSPIFQTKIAFRLSRGGSPEICVADFDGNNPIVLTHDGTLVATPSWLPGGRGLLYTSWMNGNTQIYEHNLSTGARKVFAGYAGSSFSAEVSPDGQKAAMILSKNGSPNLYVRDMDGGNLKQLTRTRDEDSSPCWSPDSRTICFVCRSGRAALQKISAEGGESTPLHVSGVYGTLTSPDWSPDGKQIAFTSGKIAFTSGSGNFNICVMPSEGGEAKILVAGEDPCWAPNSRTIIFTQRRNEKRVLCLLDVPTKHVKDIRQISGSCSEPSWAR